MEKVRCILAAVGILAVGFFCFGESPEQSLDTQRNLPQLDGNSTLADYINYAAINNPSLEAAFYEWKADAERIGQAKSLDDPRFEYKYYIEEVETRVGPQRQSIGVSQSLPWFGKLALKGQIADHKAAASAQKYEAAKLALFFEVSEAYYEYYFLGQAISTTNENINLLKHIEDVAIARYKSSKSSQPDVIRIQVEILRLEDRLAAFNDLKTAHISRLNTAMNRPVDAGLEVPQSIELYDIAIPDEQLIGLAQSSNPRLKALDADIKVAKQSIELAKKMYYPDFNLGIMMIDTDDSRIGSPSDNGKDPVIATVSLTIPLWHGKYSAGVREARNRYFAAANNKTNTANSLNTQLKSALFKYRDAMRKIDLYARSLLPKASQSMNVTEVDFRGGKADFTSLIDSQRILLEFSLSYRRALADKAIATAQIAMLTGGAVPLKVVKSSELLLDESNSLENSDNNIEREETENEK